MKNTNEFNVKIGDVVRVSGGYFFDPAIGEVTKVDDNRGYVLVKITTSASKDYYKVLSEHKWAYFFYEIIEVVSRAEPKPKLGNRTPNAYDIYFVACTNAPSGKEITFDFYPTDEELHDILSLTIQMVFSVSESSANTLLQHSTPKQWAKVLCGYVDDAIDKVIGGTDLYEIYHEQEH